MSKIRVFRYDNIMVREIMFHIVCGDRVGLWCSDDQRLFRSTFDHDKNSIQRIIADKEEIPYEKIQETCKINHKTLLKIVLAMKNLEKVG